MLRTYEGSALILPPKGQIPLESHWKRNMANMILLWYNKSLIKFSKINFNNKQLILNVFEVEKWRDKIYLPH